MGFYTQNKKFYESRLPLMYVRSNGCRDLSSAEIVTGNWSYLQAQTTDAELSFQISHQTTGFKSIQLKSKSETRQIRAVIYI